jgi:hypothetical protein
MEELSDKQPQSCAPPGFGTKTLFTYSSKSQVTELTVEELRPEIHIWHKVLNGVFADIFNKARKRYQSRALNGVFADI